MDHITSPKLPTNLTLSPNRTLQRARNSQQPLRGMVWRRPQLSRAQVRAGGIRRRAGGAVPQFQSESGACEGGGRLDGKGEVVGAD